MEVNIKVLEVLVLRTILWNVLYAEKLCLTLVIQADADDLRDLILNSIQPCYV